MTVEAVDEQIKLFFCYSHEDQALRDALEKHLSALKRSGQLVSWHDRKIEPGNVWPENINEKLNTADIILLLISASFLASDYCHEIEMKRALERHNAGEARVVPVILRPVDWQGTEFANLQALPRDAKPVVTWSSIDEALRDVAEGIRRVVLTLRPIKLANDDAYTNPKDVSRVEYNLEVGFQEIMETNVASDIVAMVSARGRKSLNEALSEDSTFAVWRKSLTSQSFTFDFPSGMNSVPVMLRLTAPNFEPMEQHTQLTLERDASSLHVALFAKTAMTGMNLLLRLDLLVEERMIASKLLRAIIRSSQGGNGGEAEPISDSSPGPTFPKPGGWAVLVTIPLIITFVNAYEPAPMTAGVEE